MISAALASFGLLATSPLPGQTEGPVPDATAPVSLPRPFVELTKQDGAPSVRAIVPLDGANVFFLNHLGQIGLAKFSPGLSQIGWQFYSEVKLPALPSIALGPNYSVVTASPGEVTQSFDTDQDVSLDFFQALVQDWPGRDAGAIITAGPAADPHGRILFALSPLSSDDGGPPRARLMAWHPGSGNIVPVTESELRIEAFAVNRDGLLAARLHMPNYPDGYFLSLTGLPPFDAEQPDAVPAPIPSTLPSLVIPAGLTKNAPPTQLCFFEEDRKEKLLITCPASRQLVEIVPENIGGVWQGAILLRSVAPAAVETLVEMSRGMVLGGGDEGFLPLTGGDDPYRITRLGLAEDGVVLEFNRSVDRLHAARPDNYTVKALAATGSTDLIISDVVIEADGRSIILKTRAIPTGTVLRVLCKNTPSEGGETLLGPEVFYTLHARAK